MGNELISFLRKTVLPMLFLLVMFSFCFDFIIIKTDRAKSTFTGLDFLRGKQLDEHGSTNIWFILVFLTAVSGFLASCFNERKQDGFGFLFALAGIILTLMAQMELSERILKSNNRPAHVDMQWAYWFYLSLLAITAGRCYLMHGRLTSTILMKKQLGGVNINIITQNSADRTQIINQSDRKINVH